MEIKREHMKYIVVLTFLALTFFVIKPFIITIVLAAIIAYFLYPVHKRLLKHVGENISTSILTATVLIFVIITVYYGINLILNESVNFYQFILNADLGEISPMIAQFSQILTSKLIAVISDQISTVMHLILSLSIFFVSLFYFIREGKEIGAAIFRNMPFEVGHKKRIFNEMKINVDAFIHVQVVIGIFQGIIAAIGLYLFGLPYPLIAGIIAMILSILPIVGPYLLYIPLGVLVYLQYGLNMAIGIVLYGIILGSIMDYVIRPLFYGKKINLHPMVTFLGIFGGLEMFGVLGIIIGPILLSISISLIKELRIKNG
jgi:predicted PurR-regulated permease PerM